MKAREFDIKHGKDGDLLEPSFRKVFSADVREGRILAVMIATPCSSFSLAQSRGGKALRSREYPRGIPQPTTERERHSIELGNACLDVTLSVIRLCNKHHIPKNAKQGYLERPKNNVFDRFQLSTSNS